MMIISLPAISSRTAPCRFTSLTLWSCHVDTPTWGQYDILYSKKITADIDLPTRFFDFYDENDRAPSPEELLNL